MHLHYTLLAAVVLISATLTGCSGSSPQPVASAEPVEKPKPLDIKELDGLWALKSSLTASEGGVYPLNMKEGNEAVMRIQNGEAEIRKGKGQFLKLGTLAVGTEPNCLLFTKTDAAGQKREMQLRFKLEGNKLTTAQDNQYPDILPNSFDLESAIDRHRQVNTYEKVER